MSEDGCEYVGAIVGLGADNSTGQPVYAEEDMEIAFDVPLSNQDLEKVGECVKNSHFFRF